MDGAAMGREPSTNTHRHTRRQRRQNTDNMNEGDTCVTGQSHIHREHKQGLSTPSKPKKKKKFPVVYVCICPFLINRVKGKSKVINVNDDIPLQSQICIM